MTTDPPAARPAQDVGRLAVAMAEALLERITGWTESCRDVYRELELTEAEAAECDRIARELVRSTATRRPEAGV